MNTKENLLLYLPLPLPCAKPYTKKRYIYTRSTILVSGVINRLAIFRLEGIIPVQAALGLPWICIYARY